MTGAAHLVNAEFGLRAWRHRTRRRAGADLNRAMIDRARERANVPPLAGPPLPPDVTEAEEDLLLRRGYGAERIARMGAAAVANALPVRRAAVTVPGDGLFHDPNFEAGFRRYATPEALAAMGMADEERRLDEDLDELLGRDD